MPIYTYNAIDSRGVRVAGCRVRLVGARQTFPPELPENVPS